MSRAERARAKRVGVELFGRARRARSKSRVSSRDLRLADERQGACPLLRNCPRTLSIFGGCRDELEAEQRSLAVQIA
jgi:hypothetical protein